MLTSPDKSHRYELRGYKLRQQLSSLLMIHDLKDNSDFDVSAEIVLQDGDFMHQLRGKDIFFVADVYAMDRIRKALQERSQLKKKATSTINDDE